MKLKYLNLYMIMWYIRRFIYRLNPDKEYEKVFEKEMKEWKEIIEQSTHKTS